MAAVNIGSISFTASAAIVTFSHSAAFVYKNGYLVASNADSSAVVPVTPGEAFSLEIHDSDVGAYSIIEDLKPQICWTDVVNADLYRIYYKSGDEYVLCFEQANLPGTEIYNIECPVELSGGWNFFKVTSVKDNVETSVEAFSHYIYEMPDPADSMAIAGGAGLFSLTVS